MAARSPRGDRPSRPTTDTVSDPDEMDPLDHSLGDGGVPGPWAGSPDPAPTDDGVAPSTSMSRLRDRGGRALALIIAATMLLPIGAWAIDSLVFAALGEDVAEAAPGLADGVALVSRRGCDGSTGSGSGFAVDLDGTPAVVTNRHVVERAAAVGIRTLDGRAGPDVTDVLLSTSDDVAVLVLEEPLDGALRIGSRPALGDRLRLVGFPGARPVTSAGDVVDVDARRIQLDLRADPGASGAPLVDDDDAVVAQVVARTPDGDAVAIPVDVVGAALRSVVPAPDC